MNKPFRPAQTLAEVARQATLEPLVPGDPRYFNLSAAQAMRDLQLLRQYIEDQSADDFRYALAAFSGHRGCGKTTQLLRLQEELAPRFTSIHVYADEQLQHDPDLDYPDLMLWLVDELVREFDARGHPIEAKLLADVIEWFASRTQEDVKALRAEASAEVEAEASGKTGLYFISLKMLARIKSMVQGSVERRQTIRRELQRYSTDLLGRVNELLDGAARVLERAGKAPDLLIVQDNLDRLKAEPAERLFVENGDLLGKLHAHVVYTAPVKMVLSAAVNTGQVFEHGYTLPTVKVQEKGGKAHKKGIDALTALLIKGVVLEYDDAACWYDVHPIMRDIAAFKDALERG